MKKSGNRSLRIGPLKIVLDGRRSRQAKGRAFADRDVMILAQEKLFKAVADLEPRFVCHHAETRSPH